MGAPQIRFAVSIMNSEIAFVMEVKKVDFEEKTNLRIKYKFDTIYPELVAFVYY